ncbi:MAG: 50S ribosomal protein L25 [Candidatus Omnitrophica bacterium]|nr:50S ribosomal protein L25 [Candidatus Omnitrophota bacterium]
MEKIEFKAKPRKQTGKGACYKIRQSGSIPGILYGVTKENWTIILEKKSTEKRLKGLKGHSVLANLVLEDNGNSKTYKTIVKEIQYNPITRDVLHIDFNLIRSDKPIVMQVPLNFTGECPGVKEGGILEHHLWELKVEALPDKIPDAINVDISTLEIGKSLFVKNISAPEEIKILTDIEHPLATVVAPRIEEVAPAPTVEEVKQPEVITQEAAEERRKEKEAKKTEQTETEPAKK